MSEYYRFVTFANPHSWLMSADNLHEQAVLIRRNGLSLMSRRDLTTGEVVTRQTANRTTFLLAGFALENAIKAFLVYENPQWVSNGKLGKPLHSHDLVSLQKKAHNIPYRTKHIWVLRSLQHGLNSWARYPCGLNAAETSEEADMRHELWEMYCKLMRAYGNRLIDLLRVGWTGPHSFEAQWNFYGSFLDER
jgi:hypothetical protein